MPIAALEPPWTLDLESLHAEVESAIRAGEPGSLRVLGYGEITLVLGWPGPNPSFAVKRLPPFESMSQLERYEELLWRYIDELERRGVPVVHTELHRPAGDPLHPYLVQPHLPRSALLNRILVNADPAYGAALLERLVAHVVAAVDARVGLDAQAANWTVEDGELACLDVSTPMLRTAAGRQEIELGPFLSVYPRAVRRPLRRVGADVMTAYHDPRTVLVDVASNLVKEHLDHWVPALVEAASRSMARPIDPGEVRSYFTRDRRLWLAMQRLRRLDRAWQRRVRRRPYPFLLPPPYAYGPPELPKENA